MAGSFERGSTARALKFNRLGRIRVAAKVNATSASREARNGAERVGRKQEWARKRATRIKEEMARDGKSFAFQRHWIFYSCITPLSRVSYSSADVEAERKVTELLSGQTLSNRLDGNPTRHVGTNRLSARRFYYGHGWTTCPNDLVFDERWMRQMICSEWKRRPCFTNGKIMRKKHRDIILLHDAWLGFRVTNWVCQQ